MFICICHWNNVYLITLFEPADDVQPRNTEEAVWRRGFFGFSIHDALTLKRRKINDGWTLRPQIGCKLWVFFIIAPTLHVREPSAF